MNSVIASMKHQYCTAAAVLAIASLATAQVTMTEIGAQSPPDTLDGYNLAPAPTDERPFFDAYDSIDLGGGLNLTLEYQLIHFGVPDQGWRPWSHEYTGSAYFLDPGTDTQVRMRPRSQANAIVVYIDPRDDSREFEFEIVGFSESGDVQSIRAAIRGGEAQGFGISVPETDRITQIAVINTDRSAGGFVVGQFLRDDGLASGCYADFDGDGELTIFDFLAYQNAFAASDPAADCDGDGSLTIFDFLCFQNEFAAGCP